MSIFTSISLLVIYLLFQSKNRSDSINSDHTRHSNSYYDPNYLNPQGPYSGYHQYNPHSFPFNPNHPLNRPVYTSYGPVPTHYYHHHSHYDPNFSHNNHNGTLYYPNHSYYPCCYLGHNPIPHSFHFPHGCANSHHYPHHGHTGHDNHYYYLQKSPKLRYIHPRLRPRWLKHRTKGYWVRGSKHPRYASSPESLDLSSVDDGYVPILNRPGRLATPGFPGYPSHPVHGTAHMPTHPPKKPSHPLIILDIGYVGPTMGYTVTDKANKKIFRANPPYLFGKVLFGSEILLRCSNNRYPHKVVYKVVNGENHLKVFFPAEKSTEPKYTPESKPGAKPPFRGVAKSGVTSSGLVAQIPIPGDVLNLKPTIQDGSKLAAKSGDLSKKVHMKSEKQPTYTVVLKETAIESGFNFYSECNERKLLKIMRDEYEEHEDLGCNYYLFNKNTNCAIIKYDGQIIWQSGDYDIDEATSASYDPEHGFIIVGNNYKGVMYKKDKDGVWRFYSSHFYTNIKPQPKPQESDADPTRTGSAPASPAKSKPPITPHSLNNCGHLKYFKLYSLDGDSLVELGPKDYVLKQELGDNFFILNDRVKCVLVQCEGYDVWARGDLGIAYPKSVCFNPADNEISVSDLRKAVVYRMDDKGAWNYAMTVPFGPNMIPIISSHSTKTSDSPTKA